MRSHITPSHLSSKQKSTIPRSENKKYPRLITCKSDGVIDLLFDRNKEAKEPIIKKKSSYKDFESFDKNVLSTPKSGYQ